jgi:hypothetical protein
MTAEDFVRALGVSVRRAAEGEIAFLENLPGRRPHSDDLELSGWFNTLTPADREMVARVAYKAADSGMYVFLSMLDGLMAFEPAGPKGALELYYKDSNGRNRIRLNAEDAQALTVLYKDLD